MIGWLYRMIVGRFTSCDHKWEKVDENQLYEDGKVPDVDLPCGIQFILRCEKCGDYKKVDV